MWRPGWYTFKEPLYGIAFALVVLVTLHRERAGKPTAVTAIGRRLADVGAYSYSLYLVHRPIQLFFEPSVRRLAAAGFLGLQPLTVSLLLMTATTPLVLMAARILYRYCEAPCVAIAQRVGHEMQPQRTVDDPLVSLAGFDHEGVGAGRSAAVQRRAAPLAGGRPSGSSSNSASTITCATADSKCSARTSR
jgi:peptidoglycan/LPS O-acetylase OafA/YrhL